MTSLHKNFVDIVKWRAENQENKPAFEFIRNNEPACETLTYGQLGHEVNNLVARLQSYDVTDKPVLILMPPGLNLISTFLAVISLRGYASIMEPPLSAQRKMLFNEILDDFQPYLIITAEKYFQEIESAVVSFATSIVCFERLPALSPPGYYLLPTISADTPCLIQYTSGSTDLPKGVVQTHGNLMHNSQLIQQSFFHTSKSYGVIWLPPYHDMGFIGGILQPLYAGFPVTLMSPRTFLQNPGSILRLISDRKATTSGGPDFSFELLRQKVADEELEGVDLSSWQVAFCGAEPINAHTLFGFQKRFAKYGFNPGAFLPCYGLAESTLFVSGVLKTEEPLVLHMDRRAYAQNMYRPAASAEEGIGIVSCGFPSYNTTVRIVNPDTCEQCRINEMGEIWIASLSNAKGYWRRGKNEIFEATLKNDDKKYLRTGDLGFLHRNQIFITGRIKDIIIINGKNHYPHNIEQSIKHAFTEMFDHGITSIAAAYNSNNKEQLMLIIETSRELSGGEGADTIVRHVRESVTKTHHIQPGLICLVPAGQILRTPNGKIQRVATAKNFLSGKMKQWSVWKNESMTFAPGDTIEKGASATDWGLSILKEKIKFAATTLEAKNILQVWFSIVIAAEIAMPATEIDPDIHFGMYGLDSVIAVMIAGKLQNAFEHLDIGPAILWDYPNLNAISWFIANELKTDVVNNEER